MPGMFGRLSPCASSAIATDVAAGGAAHAEVVDANLNSDAATQVAALILTASLSESVDAVKGLTKPQLLEWHCHGNVGMCRCGG